MKPRISVLTLGVDNLEQSLAFYHDGLGLPTKGIIDREFEHGAVAFFDLSRGLKLAIWAQDDIAHDTGLPKHPVSSTAVTIGHNVLHRQEVDEMLAAAQRAGAELIKPAQDTCYGGYAGYLRDSFKRLNQELGGQSCQNSRNACCHPLIKNPLILF